MRFLDFFSKAYNKIFKARVIGGGSRYKNRALNGLIPRHDDASVESDYGNRQRSGATDLRDFLLLFKAHPSVQACAGDVAQLAASVKIQVEQGGKKIKTGHYVKLFKRPNPNESWVTFLTTSILYLELAGNCFWELVRDPANGQLMAIYNLRPDQMSILPHATEKIAGYVYSPGRDIRIAYDKFEICHFKYPDPDDEYWGCSSLESAKSALLLDFYAMTWNKNFFKNGAEPGGTLETDQSLTEQAVKRLLETWYKRHGGSKNAHAIAILEEGLKYKPMTFKHSDMQFDVMRKMSKEEIYEAMRVPMDWRSVTAKKKSLWMDNIIPKLEMIQDVINTFLINPEGTDETEAYAVQFMTRNILSMIEEDAVKSQIANQNVTHGIWTQNEAREILYGMEGVEWGDTYWMPVGLMEWDQVNSASQATLPSDHNVNLDTQGGDRAGRSHPSQTPKLDRESRLDMARKRHPELGKAIVEESEYIDIDKMQPEFPTGGDALDYWAYRKWLNFAKKVGPDERALIALMKQFFKSQLERYRGKIRANYEPRRVKKADKPEPEPNVDAMLLDISRENQILFSVYQAKAAELLKKYGDDAMASIGAQIDFDMDTENIQRTLEGTAASKVSRINEYTRELMRRSLIESIQKGEDFDDAIRRLGDIFGPQGGVSLLRARRIARTELITFANTAKVEAAEQSGLIEKKMWICQLLPTSRKELHGANHVAMHKKVVDINEDFLVPSRSGVDVMNGPGDGTASAENLVNCLCTVEFPPTTPELQDIFEEAIDRPTRKSDEKERDVNININMGDKKVEVENISKKDDEPVRPYIIQNMINIPEIKIPEIKIPEMKFEPKFAPNIDVKQSDVHVNVPEQKAPIVNVNVPEQKAPIVNVPEQKAPVVNINPEINLEQVETEKVVERDQLGRIVSTRTKKEIKNKGKKKP